MFSSNVVNKSKYYNNRYQIYQGKDIIFILGFNLKIIPIKLCFISHRVKSFEPFCSLFLSLEFEAGKISCRNSPVIPSHPHVLLLIAIFFRFNYTKRFFLAKYIFGVQLTIICPIKTQIIKGCVINQIYMITNKHRLFPCKVNFLLSKSDYKVMDTMSCMRKYGLYRSRS